VICSEMYALTSPTGGGRSVGMVRLRTKATEFSLVSEMYNEWPKRKFYKQNQKVRFLKIALPLIQHRPLQTSRDTLYIRPLHRVFKVWP